MDYSVLKTRAFYFTAILTLLCSLLGRHLATYPGFRIIGAMVIALLLGMILQFIPGLKAYCGKSIALISNKFLRLGIILLGVKLDLAVLAASGLKTIGLAIVVVTFTTLVTFYLARLLKVEEESAILTAGGCGICGAAAVMGISPQVDAKADHSVIAVAIVAILGTLFTLLCVFLYPVLGLTDVQYGVLCGASLHEIAHVVAASDVTSEAGIQMAIIMKLARVLLLAPTALLIGLWYHKTHHAPQDGKKRKLPIPWFMLGFVLMAVLATICTSTFGKASVENVRSNVELIAFIILGMAMSSLGFSVNFQVLLKRGHKALLAAACTSVLLFGLAYCAARFLF